MPTPLILPWPASVEPRERTLHLTGKTTRHVSPLTRTTQTQELPGGRWILSATFPPLDTDQQRTMRVFLARLKGVQGYFYFPADATALPLPSQPAGAGPEMVTVGPRLAVQTGALTLRTRGWGAGELVFSAGEYVSVDDAAGWRRLHLVTADAWSDNAGEAALQVEPPVRYETVENARLHYECPSAVFRLASDEEGAISQTADGFASLSIQAVEAPRPRSLIA